MKIHSLLYHVFMVACGVTSLVINEYVYVISKQIINKTTVRRCELVFLQIEWFNDEKAGTKTIATALTNQ